MGQKRNKIRRVIFQETLETFLGITNVYFQPPESFKLKYPCVIYEMSGDFNRPADNEPYFARIVYQVKLIDRDPDSPLYEKLKSFPYAKQVRHFVSNNLHNWVFNIYF